MIGRSGTGGGDLHRRAAYSISVSPRFLFTLEFIMTYLFVH